MGNRLSGAMSAFPTLPTMSEMRKQLLNEPDDEDDAAPYEAFTAYYFVLTLLPRRNLKGGTRVLALRDPEEDPTDLKWYGAVISGDSVVVGSTTYYTIKFLEGPDKGSSSLRHPHHRLLLDPWSSSRASEYTTQQQDPSMLGLPDTNSGHRFRIGDKLLLKGSNASNPFTVTARLGNMLRLEGNGRDMFFPEMHVGLSLHSKGDPDKDPNKGEPSYDRMIVSDNLKQVFRKINELLPSVEVTVTEEHVNKLTRHLKEVSNKQIVRRAIDPAYNPLIRFSFVHWVMREDGDGYFKICEVLFDHGGDPNLIDFVGLTPLYNACVYGLVDTARYLIANGADPLMPAPGLLTPVHLMLSDQFNIPDSLAETALRRRRRQKRSMQNASKMVTYNYTWLDHIKVKPPKKFFLLQADTGPWENHVGGESTLAVIIRDGHLGALGTPLIEHLIEHKWMAFAGRRSFLDSFMALALALAVVADTFLRPHRDNTDAVESLATAGLICSIVLLVWSGILMIKELWDLLSDRELWFLDFWNPTELVTYFVTLAYSAGDLLLELNKVPLHLSDGKDEGSSGSEWEHWLQLFQAAAGFLVWVRLLKYVAIFESVGHLVNVILKMFREFAIFLVVFAAIFLGFTHALYVLSENELHGPHAVLNTAIKAFEMMVGEFDYEEDYSHKASLIILFVAYILIAMILMLNLLIAQLSNVYSEVSGGAKAQFFLNRARITLEKEKELPRQQRLVHSTRRILYRTESLPAKIVASLFEEEEMEAAETHRRNLITLTKVQLEQLKIAAGKDPEEEARKNALTERLNSVRGPAASRTAQGATTLPIPQQQQAQARQQDAVSEDSYEDQLPERPLRGPRTPRFMMPCFVPSGPGSGSGSTNRFSLFKRNKAGAAKPGARTGGGEEEEEAEEESDDDSDFDSSDDNTTSDEE